VHLAPEEAAGWAKRAELRAATGDLSAAAADVERALGLDPGYVVAWTARATIRRQRGDLAGAEADLTRALGLELDSVWSLTERAGFEATRVTERVRGQTSLAPWCRIRPTAALSRTDRDSRPLSTP
jgi:tetratricopeptide (TPR) repeat protein